jgi:photosystem II stability/assembly factor-like uncharacterized protein
MFSGIGPADRLLVGTAGGIYGLQRADDRKWHVAWTALQGHHISSIETDPESGALFAGIYGGGISASTDDGKTWHARDAGLSSANVYSLTLADAAGGKKLFAGTEPAHLFESTDMGDSWTELRSLRDAPSLPDWTFPAPPHIAHAKFIAVAPHDPDVMYVAIEVGGLLKSQDGGLGWEELHGFYEDVHRIMICGNDPDSVYITTGNGLFHTANGGRTWKRMTEPTFAIAYPDPLVVVPGRENLMFMAGATGAPRTWHKTRHAESHIGRSRDGGETWELLSGGLPVPVDGNIEAMSLMSWPGGFELFAATTGGDIYCSDDEGEHWSKIIDGLPSIAKSRHDKILQPA